MSMWTHSQIFEERLQNRSIQLRNAAQIVQLSSIVKPSISYLDLQITKKKYSHIVLNTEEKCRKFFHPNRRLLYTLNLDLPPGREITMKNDVNPYKFNDDSITSTNTISRANSIISIAHIETITIQSGFEVMILSNFLKEALEIIDCKLKTLEDSPRWIFLHRRFVITKKKIKIVEFLLKSPFLCIVFFIQLKEPRIVDSLIGSFYPENTHSATFRSFLKNFNVARYISTGENPQFMEFLLRYALLHGRNFEREGFSMRFMIDICILNRLFLNVEPILMYTNSPEYSPQAYDWYKLKITSLRPDVTRELIAKMETWLRPERAYLLLQMFWFVRNRRRLPYVIRDNSPITADTKCLHWIWSSIPDPFLSAAEVFNAFKGALGSFEIGNLFSCYAIHVGCLQMRVSPRSLKHLSRIAVRGMLQKTGRYLPEAIQNCEIPNQLKKYLNLERNEDYLQKVQEECRQIFPHPG